MARFADQGLKLGLNFYAGHKTWAGTFFEGQTAWAETFLQAKKRRAEALDGVAGDIGDVCRARFEPPFARVTTIYRPTWEDMIIAYSTIPGYASLR